MGRKMKKKVEFVEPESKHDLETSSSSSDSESDAFEDDDGALVTPEVDAQILRTLAEIRSRNQKIYDPSSRFFDEAELERASEEWARRQAEKGEKVTLTDYQRERLLSGKLDEEEGEEYEEEEYRRPLTHAEEQEKLKAEFKRAFADEQEEADEVGEDVGGLFKKRPKTAEQLVKEEEDYRAFLLENLSRSQNARESMGDWLSYKADRGDKTGGSGQGIDSEEQFLIDYVLNRGWIDQEKKVIPDYEKIIGEDEEDLEAVERAEEFETALNFRFEQPGAEQVVTYSRSIEGSMRREENKRKEARAAKKARKEEAALKHKEEVKRKKNTLKGELLERLSKIQEIADLKGKRVEELESALDLEASDFDLEEHDKRMAGLFDESFYEADDTEKPTFSDDDGEYPISADVTNSNDESESKDGDEREKEDLPADEDSEDEFKTKIVERKEDKKSNSKSAIAKIREALYELDCEDVIGTGPDALSCRFRYTKTLPTSFGLETREILAADDALLNEHVSLKRLAPYRPEEWQREDGKRFGDKRKVYMLRKRMWEQEAVEREARKKRKEEQRAQARALKEAISSKSGKMKKKNSSKSFTKTSKGNKP